jgi:cell division transport system permease protein
MNTIDTTWAHIRRSPYQALAAVLTMFLTFLVTGAFTLTITTSFLILRYFESKPQVTVFFGDKAGQTEADALKATLEGTGKTASIKFVSKEEALTIYKEQNKNDPLLLEMVTADILPASLEVSATDPRFLKELEPIMKSAAGVEEVVYQKDVVDTLLSWTNAIRLVGGALVILLSLDAILIVMTIIGMKVALKKEEVEILKLIGASQWYIRFPFILEGGSYGVVGGFLAWMIIEGLLIWLRPGLFSFLNGIPLLNIILANPLGSPFILTSIGFLLVLSSLGFLLGAIGSLVALGKYIKF